MQKITIDLRNPPEERWHLTPEQQQQACELLSLYKADLGIPHDLGEFLAASARDLVRSDHWAELECFGVRPYDTSSSRRPRGCTDPSDG